MRILFVAMAQSIHTARWINQLADQNWDIHLFPTSDSGVNSHLKNVTIHNYFNSKPSRVQKSVRVAGSWPLSRGLGTARKILKKWLALPDERPWLLANTIKKLQPDIVHSLEIQHAGYLTLDAKSYLKTPFPLWIVTNWGSDIYLFGRLGEHRNRIKAVLSACDYYDCECSRDAELARTFGFQGEVLPILPNTGGFDLDSIREDRQPGPTSSRRLIVLKGYQHWAGRALVALRAIELSAGVLNGYRVSIHSASEDVRIAAALVSASTGIPIEIVPFSSHERILRLHGQARVSIGLSISDAISTSLIEAMTMGSFPIQSNTSCANEWIQCGKTGFLVSPEDPQEVAEAIRCAITDDVLVDQAAETNYKIVNERLDQSLIQPRVIAMYKRIGSCATMKGNGHGIP